MPSARPAIPGQQANLLSPTDSYSQHVVTAVIVAHDGAAWLPRLMEALNEQTKPVQRVVAVDTGSRDRSGSVLAALVGQSAVFGMDRTAGYAAAVRRAVQHKAANAPVPGGQSSRGHADQVEWLWLLHDDCEPAADALEQLLRGAAETPTAAVLGPKLMDWTDRDVIVEAGLTIDTAGRRITGIEPREVDQGQHDGDRDVLAVSSAGMLVRRDVWEQTAGFDPGMTLFGEDVDFCWRVHAAGYRVRVITDAVVFHAQAASHRRRAISVGRRARLLERRNGLVTLLGNLPFAAMLISLAGNLMLSLTRTVFYLVAKRPAAALDESAAVLAVVGHPLKLSNARRRRARGRRAAYSRLRADLPAGRSIRRIAEFVATVVSRPAPEDLAGAHHATDDPTDDDSLLVDTGVLQRLLTRPGVLLLLALIVITGGRGAVPGDQRHARRRSAAARVGRRIRPVVGVPARLSPDRDRLGEPRAAVCGIPGAGSDDPARQGLAGHRRAAARLRAAGGHHRLPRTAPRHQVGCHPCLGSGLLRAAADRIRRHLGWPARQRGRVRADPADRAAGRPDVQRAAEASPPGRVGHRAGGHRRRRVCAAAVADGRGRRGSCRARSAAVGTDAAAQPGASSS